MDKVMKNWMKKHKQANPKLDEFHHETDMRCPSCKRHATIVSAIHVDHAVVVDGHQSCNHTCMACGFSGASKREF